MVFKYLNELAPQYLGECIVNIANVFIGLKKAFDTADHDILLKKLIRYGISDLEHSWFASYLKNRRQFCKVNGAFSQIKDVTCGIPQGSCLGPLLFLIYINDLPLAVQNCNVTADDTIPVFHMHQKI